jgi:hypothetical protein
VTTSATRGVREVLGSVLVTVEARLPSRTRKLAVAGMTRRARLVLGLGVQARQRSELVTRRAGGRRRNAGGTAGAARTVWAVAAHAARSEHAVRGLRLVCVTGAARFLAFPAVRFVTIRARSMSGGRRAVLFLVAIAARGQLGAGMRFVTLHAARVTPRDARVLTRVTLLATDFVRLGMMG